VLFKGQLQLGNSISECLDKPLDGLTTRLHGLVQRMLQLNLLSTKQLIHAPEKKRDSNHAATAH